MSKAHPGSSIKYLKKQKVRDKRADQRKLLNEAKNIIKNMFPGINIKENRWLLVKTKKLVKEKMDQTNASRVQ